MRAFEDDGTEGGTGGGVVEKTTDTSSWSNVGRKVRAGRRGRLSGGGGGDPTRKEKKAPRQGWRRVGRGGVGDGNQSTKGRKYCKKTREPTEHFQSE